MGNDLSSSSDYLKQLQNTIMQDSWLESIYGKNKAEQQSELKKVFNVIADNDVTSAQKKSLETRKETLAEQVERLEAKMAVLQEQMAKLQDQVSKKADEITELVSKAKGKSQELEEKQGKYVKEAISDVFYMYNNGLIGKDAITAEIRRRIQDSAYKEGLGKEVESILAKLDNKQAEVSGLVNDTTKLIDQKKLLEGQYGATKSTYDFINLNLTKIGATETNYTNADTNTALPVYSLEKTSIVTGMFENTNYNVEPGANTNYKEGSTAPETVNLTEKYGKYLNTKATAGDKNSSKNKAVQNLGKAMNAGLLDDIKAAGMSGSDVVKFFAENFAGANIKLNKDGSLSIPYGHDESSKKTFNKLTSFIKNYDTTFRGQLNTWDKNGGNTIDSNKQIASLADNYDAILTKLGKQEPKFTFKEAMFALFNPETGLFKNSGVNYDVSKQEGNPNYSITPAGDDKTANMYKGLADKIYEIWGIKPNSSNIGADNFDEEKPKPVTPKRTDPITFRDETGKEFAFIIDKDGNGSFDGPEEFVGGNGKTSWLDDLKSLDKNGDGKLTGDELKELKLLGSDYTDNAQTKYKDNKYLREETTNIEYTLTNAEKLGISEINLANLEGNVNKSTGKYDINGSELFNDGFSFKMGDKEYTAGRKDDTNAFMDAVYKAAYGKGFTFGISDIEADAILNKDYGEYDQFANGFNEIEADYNILKNSDEIAKNSRQAYNDTLDRVEADEKAQLYRASNRAAALSSGGNWASVQREIQEIATKEGIVVDMLQAKGIYNRDVGLSAREVVNKYKEMVSNEQSIAFEKSIDKEVWDAIVLGAKANVNASPDKVRKLFSEGKAKNAQEAIDILLKDSPEAEYKVTTQKLEFNSEREKELVSAFQKVFTEAGLKDKIVDGLYDLVVKGQEDKNYMDGKSGEDLAKEMLKKYQG